MKSRGLTDADWDAFVTFAKEEFGQSHITDRAFNEHWFKTPRSDGWAGRISENPDGSLSGAMMFIVVPAWFEGEETRLAWISSGVVQEEARKRGEGALLYFWGYRGFPLVGSMSGNAFSNPINDRMGIRIPGLGMRRFLFIHRAETAALCQPERRGRIDPAAFPPAEETGLEAEWLESTPADFDPLWRRVRQGLLVTTDRSAAYYRWRYETAPFLRYRFLALRRAGALVGLAVTRIQETPAGPVCRVVDFVAEPSEAAAVWRRLLAASAESGALFTDFLVIGSSQDRALGEAGFKPADADSGLDCVPHLLSPVEHRPWSNTFHLGGALARASEAWRKPEAIYFTKGDGDRDWPTAHDLARLGVAA